MKMQRKSHESDRNESHSQKGNAKRGTLSSELEESISEMFWFKQMQQVFSPYWAARLESVPVRISTSD